MKKLILKSIDLIDVDSDANKHEHSGIFGFEPTLKEEESLGSIFLIGETEKQNENSSYIINLIASIIKKEYYSDTSITSEKALENSLKKANDSLNDLKGQGNEQLVKSLRFVVAAYADSLLNISQIGDVQSLIIREGGLTDIGQAIPGNTDGESVYFSNIASGEIVEDDVIIFSSSPLDETKIDIIKEGFEKNSSFDKAEKHIRKKFVNFGEVILILQSKEEIEEVQKEEKSNVSPDLILKQNDFEEERVMNEKEIVQDEKSNELDAKKSLPEDDDDRAIRELKSEILSENIEEDELLAKNPMIKETAGVTSSFSNLKDKIWNVKDGLSAKLSRKKNTDEVEVQKNEAPTSLRQNLETAPGNQWSKYLYLAGTILLGVFLIFIGYKTYQFITPEDDDVTGNNTENSTNNENDTSDIDNKLNQIDQAIQSGNTSQARSLIKTTLTDINALDESTKASKLQKINEFVRSIDLGKVVNFEEVAAIQTDNLPTSTSGLAMYAEKVYYVGTPGLISYDTNNKKFTTLHNEFDYASVNTVKEIDGRIFFQTSSNKQALYRLSNDTFQDYNFSSSQTTATGVAGIYGENVYIPSADNKSIIKFKKSSTGFSPGETWTDKIDGTKINDLTIDGSIFTLNSSGKIAKFYQGDAQTFSTPDMIYDMSNAQAIDTDADLNNLYILDKMNKRIVIISKESNNLKAILESEQLYNALDANVYVRHKKIYVLTSDKILALSINEYEN